jgi:hypothetical protein
MKRSKAPHGRVQDTGLDPCVMAFIVVILDPAFSTASPMRPVAAGFMRIRAPRSGVKRPANSPPHRAAAGFSTRIFLLT